MLATLRVFLREGTPWRSLRATAEKASGSTLRRCLAAWSRTGLLGRVHALPIRMLRGHPDLILDSCFVRAKRGGDLTGPNPTDRVKKGSKYHVATTGDGLPVACAVTGANVPDTLLFERLFLVGFAVRARIRTVLADKGYDAERHRELCRKFSTQAAHSPAWAGTRIRPRQATLASGAHHRLAAEEQATGAPLRSLRLHHPVPAPDRMHIPGCRTACSGILKTALSILHDLALDFEFIPYSLHFQSVRELFETRSRLLHYCWHFQPAIVLLRCLNVLLT